MEDERLSDIAQKLGILGQRAKARAESYLNSPIADMPMWDRIMIEYLLEYEDKIEKLQKDVDEVLAILKPAPEHELE